MVARQLAGCTLVATTLMLACGCGQSQDPRQVYAASLSLYNAETEALQRLQQQRQGLEEDYQQQVAQVVREHKQAAVAGQLGSVATELLGGLGGLQDGEEPLTEDNVLDRLEDIQGLDVESVLQQAQDMNAALKTLPPAAQQEIDQAKQQLDEKLAPLDAEIDRQQQRVDKAREAKETAEAALNR